MEPATPVVKALSLRCTADCWEVAGVAAVAVTRSRVGDSSRNLADLRGIIGDAIVSERHS